MYDSGEPPPGVSGALFMFGLSIATGAVAFVAWRTSASRRLRDVGLLASSGATPGQLIAVQAIQGFLIATAAVAAAIAIGLASLQLASVERALTPGDQIDPSLDVAGIVSPSLIAIVAATLAAALPAWQATRVPLSSVLAGRFVTSKQNPLSPVLGVVLVLAGLFMLALSVQGFNTYGSLVFGGGGMIALAVGALPIFSAIFRVGEYRPLADTLPVTQRLAVRSLARHAGRSAAAVLGIGAVVAAVWAGSIDAQENLDGGGRFGPADGPAISRSDLNFGFGATGNALEGVFVTLSNPDPDARAEQARVLLQAEPAAQQFDLLAFENSDYQLIEFSSSTEIQDDRLASSIQESLPIDAVFQGSGIFREIETPVLDDEDRVPAFDTTVVALPVDIDGELLAELTEDAQLLVTGIGRDLPLGIDEDRSGDEQAQLILTAIGVAVAAFVIALVVYVMLEEAREESSLLTSLGSKTSATSQFLSTQVFVLASSGVVGGLVFGTLIRFAVDVGFYLPTRVFLVLLALPFVLTALAYPFGLSQRGGNPSQPTLLPSSAV